MPLIRTAGQAVEAASSLDDGQIQDLSFGGRDFKVSRFDNGYAVECSTEGAVGYQEIPFDNRPGSRERAASLVGRWIIDHPFGRVTRRMLASYEAGRIPSLGDRLAAGTGPQPKVPFQDSGTNNEGYAGGPLVPGAETPAVEPPAPAKAPPLAETVEDRSHKETTSALVAPKSKFDLMVTRVACANPDLTRDQVLSLVAEVENGLEGL